MSLILYSQLHERLKDGVWRLLQDLFGHGSIVSLQADGGPAEYTIRVRFWIMWQFGPWISVLGPGEQPPGAKTCVHRGKGVPALALIGFMQR